MLMLCLSWGRGFILLNVGIIKNIFSVEKIKPSAQKQLDNEIFVSKELCRA